MQGSFLQSAKFEEVVQVVFWGVDTYSVRADTLKKVSELTELCD